MIILFALLPALVFGAESAIDWTKCGDSENTCHCRDSPTNSKLRSFVYDAAEGLTRCADFGIQNIYYSEKKVVFLMQVMNGDANTIDSTMELALFSEKAGDSVKLFGCELKDGKVKLAADPESIAKYKISLFEEGDRGTLGDASFFKKGHILCAIFVDRGSGLHKYMQTRKGAYTTVMKLTGTSPKVYKLEFAADIFNIAQIRCPYFSFQSRLRSKPYETKPVLNKDKDVQNCANYGNSYSMKYENLSKSETEMEKLECIKDGSGFNLFLTYNTINATGHTVQESEKILNPEPYAIFCAAPVDELCTKPMTCDENNDKTCPKFKAGSKGVKAELTCTDSKWLINDDYFIGTVECRRDEYFNSNGPAFFAKLPTGQTEIKDTVRCFTEYDCEKKSIVRRAGNNTVVIEKGVMRCTDGEKQLTIYHEESNVTLNGNSSYTCDPKDGLWKNDTFVVPVGSIASCKAKAKPQEEAAPMISTGAGTLYAVFGSLLVIAVILAVEALIYYCWKRGLLSKNNMKVTAIMGKHYKDMPRSELIADCKEHFGNCLQATPDTYYLVLEGLKKIDMLLKEEVEDADAWEEAYKFLMRFHGSIRLVDRQIWHMFSRYLYLETKKIVDKHGWWANEPVRLGTPKGLIRAVAMHLLSFSLHDCENYDSEKLLIAGFRALGFHAVGQYPHCGLMWSLVYHTRPRLLKRKTGPNKIQFDGNKFEERLNHFVHSKSSIPADEIIPVFGTVPHQAAFAIGALPDTAYIHAHSEELALRMKHDENKVQTGFFEGLCQSVMHNPITNIISAFNLAKPNPETLQKLHKAAPEAEWSAVAREGERTMTYYGHHLDAKRLHERFMPDDKDTDFFKMQMDQQEFEGAVEKARNDLRPWFSARTDKEEFKQKPAEVTNPQILANVDKKFGDYAVQPRPAPPSKKASAAGSKSTSGSNHSAGGGGGSSGSNSSDGKSPAPPPPSEPKEAAAPAAAAPPASN